MLAKSEHVATDGGHGGVHEEEGNEGDPEAMDFIQTEGCANRENEEHDE
jgi:hypothetical protein